MVHQIKPHPVQNCRRPSRLHCCTRDVPKQRGGCKPEPQEHTDHSASCSALLVLADKALLQAHATSLSQVLLPWLLQGQPGGWLLLNLHTATGRPLTPERPQVRYSGCCQL